MTDRDLTKSGGLPASPLRQFKFHDGETEILARYANLVQGDPDRLFLFGAREIDVQGVEVTPPRRFDSDSEWSAMRAYYTGEAGNTILYFMENWGGMAATGFTECSLILELHELTHWAIPVEDNETEPDHWERWDCVLTEVVEFVMDIDTWDISEYNPEIDTGESEKAETDQATLMDVIGS